MFLSFLVSKTEEAASNLLEIRYMTSLIEIIEILLIYTYQKDKLKYFIYCCSTYISQDDNIIEGKKIT